MAVSIEWGTRIISVPRADLTLIQSAPTEIREMDLNWFRLQLKNLEDSENGIPMPDTHKHNTEVTLGSLTFARVIEMINGYTVTFEDGQYAINLTGANSNVGDVVNVNQVSVRSSNSAGLISSPAIEYSSFNGGVIVDVNSGISGTIFPRGTEQMKVNNIPDAILIAQYRGFNKIYFHSNITLGSESNLDNFIFVGQSHVNIKLTIEEIANVENVVITECQITGVLDGGNSLSTCIVGNITYLNGHIHNSSLIGEIILDGNKDAYIVNCKQSDMNAIPEVNLGGSGQDLVMPDYSGNLIIKNSTNPINKVGIGLTGGVVKVLPTFTDGLIHISGTGRLIDENDIHISSGIWNGNVTIVNELLSKATIAESVSDSYTDKIYIDVVNGSSTTSPPSGTKKYPIDNILDALIVANREGINTLHIIGSLDLVGGVDVSGYTFTSYRSVGNSLILTDCITIGTYFDNLTISGNMNGRGRFTYCAILGITNFDGGIKNSLLLGTIQFSGTAICYLTDTDTFITTPGSSITLNIGTTSVNIIRAAGNYTISNKSGTDLTHIGIVYGHIIINNSCVNGYVDVEGIGVCTDNSNGSTVHKEDLVSPSEITDQVLDELVSEHQNTGSLGNVVSKVNYLEKITKNKKELKKTGSVWELIIYDDDGLTEILNKEMKDLNDNDITDLAAGVLAKEVANTI